MSIQSEKDANTISSKALCAFLSSTHFSPPDPATKKLVSQSSHAIGADTLTLGSDVINLNSVKLATQLPMRKFNDHCTSLFPTKIA